MTNADTATRHIGIVTRIVGDDSVRLAQQGLPYRPAQGVSLVTDSLTCRATVNAYNALLPSTSDSRAITRAYVMRVGTSVYAMVGEKTRNGYVFFDTTYRRLAGMLAAH
jgi:hypothetical protein